MGTWRSNSYMGNDLIASGGDDNVVYLWINKTQRDNDESISSNNASEWKKFELRKFNTGISKLSWEDNGSQGNHLLISTSDGVVYLFKEALEGNWDLVSMSNNEGVMEEVED